MSVVIQHLDVEDTFGSFQISIHVLELAVEPAVKI